MRNFYITIDVEPDIHTKRYEFFESIPIFLNLLKKYNIKATFFITGDCLEKNPKIFKEIRKKGHELALHGYEHKRFDIRSYEEKKRDIKQALFCFNKYLNLKPLGFRAPQPSINEETISILNANTFKYDSSLTPWNLYHLIVFWKIKLNFFDNFTSMRPYKKQEILEIPISSLALPFSAMTLRILPKSLLKIYLFFISFYKNPVFFMHSWDLIEIPESKIYKLCPKEEFLQKFEFMLNYLSKKAGSDKLVNLSHSM